MREILPQVEELMLSLKQLMPSIYQQETLESILGLFLSGKGNAVPHHCQTKSESAISRFLKKKTNSSNYARLNNTRKSWKFSSS